MSPQDISRFVDIGSVQLSAGSKYVAIAVTRPDLGSNRNARSILVGLSAGDNGGFEALSSVDGGVDGYLPTWSPTGTAIASVWQKDSGWQIQVNDLAAKTDRLVLTAWPDPIEEVVWSPDGKQILFVVREPTDREWWNATEDRRPPLRIKQLRYREDGIGWTFNRPRQGYLVSLSSGATTKLSQGGYDDTDYSWHPSGESVVFVSQRQAARDRTLLNDVYIQELSDLTALRTLTATAHCYSRPQISPDGSRLALNFMDVQHFPATDDLGLITLGTGEMRVLSEQLDRDCSSAQTSGRGPVWLGLHDIMALVEDSGAIHGYRFSADSPDNYCVELGGKRRITSVDAKSDLMVFVASSPIRPPELFVRGSDGIETSLYAPNESIRSARNLGEPTQAQTSVQQDTVVDSWLSLPDQSRWPGPYPLLVCLQGGGTQLGYQWSHEIQTLRAAGFATLYLNPRGSAGYGNAWSRAVSGPGAAAPGSGWGVDDIADIEAVVQDTLDKNPTLDITRVGVHGGSYGGLVVAWLLATTDKFNAGWAERGPYNLYSDAGTHDEAPWFFETYLGRNHLDDPAAYWNTSPLSVASGITAPLAIVHSEGDLRCPIQQAEELFMALKLLDREVEFIRFPGEGHGLTRSGSPVHRLQRLEILVEWFTTWLRP